MESCLLIMVKKNNGGRKEESRKGVTLKELLLRNLYTVLQTK